MNNKIETLEELQKREVTPFNVGDTIKVQYKVIEGGKSRTQTFQGIVIQKKGAGIKSTFTVRKISFGVGVEKIFPLHSPNIKKIQVINRGKVRRSKLFYIREKVGKKARIKEKRRE
ncbi:MAG: 50S ribosomal protein L19 [Actinobacteria bacterium]|nr:MAG: 50S ribosomal protein L19 [Actinomycetota bacterium]